MLISENWPYLLDPGIRTWFEMQRSALAAASLIPVLFNVNSSSKAVEYDSAVGGMSDFPEYGGRLDSDDVDAMWRVSYTHVEYAKEFSIERKLAEDDQYNIMNGRARQFATAAMRTREKSAASVFNNAFTAGAYAGYDAYGLCSNSHPYSPVNATAIDNYLTLALSHDNMVTARETMRAFVDDRGELVSVNPTLLLVPPELEATANDILMTVRGVNSQQPDTANYAANLMQDRGFKYVVWDYLTDSNAWFLIDLQLAKLYLNWFDRVPLEIAMDPNSNYQLEGKWRGYMRYSHGWSDFRWVIGSNPS